jgi:hypothetical protein
VAPHDTEAATNISTAKTNDAITVRMYSPSHLH